MATQYYLPAIDILPRWAVGARHRSRPVQRDRKDTCSTCVDVRPAHPSRGRGTTGRATAVRRAASRAGVHAGRSVRPTATGLSTRAGARSCRGVAVRAGGGRAARVRARGGRAVPVRLRDEKGGAASGQRHDIRPRPARSTPSRRAVHSPNCAASTSRRSTRAAPAPEAQAGLIRRQRRAVEHPSRPNQMCRRVRDAVEVRGMLSDSAPASSVDAVHRVPNRRR